MELWDQHTKWHFSHWLLRKHQRTSAASPLSSETIPENKWPQKSEKIITVLKCSGSLGMYLLPVRMLFWIPNSSKYLDSMGRKSKQKWPFVLITVQTRLELARLRWIEVSNRSIQCHCVPFWDYSHHKYRNEEMQKYFTQENRES